jgi:aminopeptidase N
MARLLLSVSARVLALTVCILTANATATSLTEFVSHDLRVKIDLPGQTARTEDQGSLKMAPGWNLFFIASNAKLDSFTVGGGSVQRLVFASTDTLTLPPEIKSAMPKDVEIPTSKMVFFKSRKADSTSFYIRYSATYADDVKDVHFSRESIGREINGSISDTGAYISGGGLFYPQGGEKRAYFAVTADIPAAWHSILDGNLEKSAVSGVRRVESWRNPFLSDGCTFMAAPYVVVTSNKNGVDVFCYFYAVDTALAANYLTATENYLKMYSDLIGPYPYKRFTVAENFFPTGYGMPGWTLLGQSVIRLPFIIASSLGHEVLHNWWGNSVYVDHSKGNWCEGLTTYGADYRYKLNESPAAAKSYRKDLLKEYVSYVGKDKDFPLREFTERSSPSTRAIGYGKCMMVFHMIENWIGTKAFFQAWKDVYATHRGDKIAWEDWIAAFEKSSGQKLDFVIPQWIDRAGAPVLAFSAKEVGTDGAGKTLELKISESTGTPYKLRIPIRVQGPESGPDSFIRDTFVTMTDTTATMSFQVPSTTASVTLDPDFDLFRKMYPDEIEPIISGVLGVPKKVLVNYATDFQLAGALNAFGANFSEDTLKMVATNALATIDKATAPIVLNPPELPPAIAGQLKLTSDSIYIGGTSYGRKGHTVVMAANNWNGLDKAVLIISDDAVSLPRVGELVPHYGKYSWLIFDAAAKNVGKGQWEVGQSPLRVDLTTIRGGR